MDGVISHQQDLKSKFNNLQSLSRRAYDEFKQLKQKYSDLYEENELTKTQLKETQTKLETTESAFTKLKEVSKKAMSEFNVLKSKYTEEVEKRALLEENLIAMQNNTQDASLREELSNAKAQIERLEKKSKEMKESFSLKEAALQSQVAKIQNDLVAEVQKRQNLEKEVWQLKCELKVPSKSIDELLKEVEKKIQDPGFGFLQQPLSSIPSPPVQSKPEAIPVPRSRSNPAPNLKAIPLPPPLPAVNGTNHFIPSAPPPVPLKQFPPLPSPPLPPITNSPLPYPPEKPHSSSATSPQAFRPKTPPPPPENPANSLPPPNLTNKHVSASNLVANQPIQVVRFHPGGSVAKLLQKYTPETLTKAKRDIGTENNGEIGSEETNGVYSDTTNQIQQGVRLRKVTLPPKKENRRPLSVHNMGPMGQLGSLLCQTRSLDENDFEKRGNSNENRDINELFEELEKSLGV